jgi:hypothetical protein
MMEWSHRQAAVIEGISSCRLRITNQTNLKQSNPTRREGRTAYSGIIFLGFAPAPFNPFYPFVSVFT